MNRSSRECVRFRRVVLQRKFIVLIHRVDSDRSVRQFELHHELIIILRIKRVNKTTSLQTGSSGFGSM